MRSDWGCGQGSCSDQTDRGRACKVRKRGQALPASGCNEEYREKKQWWEITKPNEIDLKRFTISLVWNPESVAYGLWVQSFKFRAKPSFHVQQAFWHFPIHGGPRSFRFQPGEILNIAEVEAQCCDQSCVQHQSLGKHQQYATTLAVRATSVQWSNLNSSLKIPSWTCCDRYYLFALASSLNRWICYERAQGEGIGARTNPSRIKTHCAKPTELPSWQINKTIERNRLNRSKLTEKSDETGQIDCRTCGFGRYLNSNSFSFDGFSYP